jgi:hypothetical protein
MAQSGGYGWAIAPCLTAITAVAGTISLPAAANPRPATEPPIAPESAPMDLAVQLAQGPAANPQPPRLSQSESLSPLPSSPPVALDFTPPPIPSSTVRLRHSTSAQSSRAHVAVPSPIHHSADPHGGNPSTHRPIPSSTHPSLFSGDSNSLVARAVGAAEGNLTPRGDRTENYHGHVDPGNGVWNRGTFSYQFGNEENLSAEEANRRQIAKIQRVYESVLLAKAEQQGVLPLTLAETLNGIDLINQAPLAVTEAGGYIEQLAEAKQRNQLVGDAAILEARVEAFWDPQRNDWDAPGLRAYDDLGKRASIEHDQQRRMAMITETLQIYQQEERQRAIAERIIHGP